MEDITTWVLEDLVLWLRVRAGKKNLSMSRWVAGVLADMRRREDADEAVLGKKAAASGMG